MCYNRMADKRRIMRLYEMELTKSISDKVIKDREDFASYMISKRNDANLHVGGYFPTLYGVLHLYWQRQMWAYDYIELNSWEDYTEFSLLNK